MSNVKVLNIKPLAPQVKVTVVIDDVRHNRAEPTVEDLIATIEDLEALAEATKMSEQIKLTLRVICRSFPSMSEADLRKQPAEVLNGLFDAARGEIEMESEDSEGNVKPAS